jgi:hypothetical protein
MATRLGIALSVLAALSACAAPGQEGPQVVREGEGWREVESGGGNGGAPDAKPETRIEITTTDPAALAAIARAHPESRARLEAVRRLGDPNVLSQVAASDADPAVKQAAADRADVLRSIGSSHLEYRSWTSFKEGAWVTFNLELLEGEGKYPLQVRRTLALPGPDRTVLEQKVVATGRGPQGRFRSMLAQVDRGLARRSEGQEAVGVGGRRLDCRWTSYVAERERTIVRVKLWFRDEIPGGIARMLIEEAPEGAPLRSLTAVAVSWGSP